MAKPTLVLTQRDRDRAAELNRVSILARISRYTDPALADFLKHNYKALHPLLKKHAPLFFEPHQKNEEETKAVFAEVRSALKKMTLGIAESVDMKKLAIEPVKPEEFAQRRLERQINRAAEIQNSNAALARSAKHVGSFLRKTVSIPVMLATGGLDLIVASANAVEAFYDRGSISKTTRAAITGAAWVGVAGLGMSETSAAPFYTHNPNLAGAFHEACEPGMPVKDAVFARAFNEGGNLSPLRHARDTMLSGARMGVPAIALHLVSYLETGKFTDMQANNSSAEGPFQMLRSTKALYIKEHGRQTEYYKEAKQRITNGSATVNDKSAVRAFDAVAAMSKEKLLEDVALKKVTGPIFDALQHAGLSHVAAQLVALDITDKSPEIKNPRLSIEQTVDIMSQYYAKNHYLGMGTHSSLTRLAKNHPTLAITDFKKVSAVAGITLANHLKEVTNGNPAFSKKNITAGEYLTNVVAKFKEYVAEPVAQFKMHEAKYKTTMEACSINGEKSPYPETITNFQAIGITLGLTSLQEKFKPEVTKTEAPKTKTQPAPPPPKTMTVPLPPIRPKGPGTNV